VRKRTISPRAALVLFVVLAAFVLALAVWWIIFMARLVDEKVDMAAELGADDAYLEEIHRQEVRRQTMLGMEGVFFLILVLVGAWLIYRSLVRTEELKFHQQNFLMAVTHELKTPLASMKIYLDSMRSDKIPVEKKAEIIPRMQADVSRLEKLVENILDAGRFERSGYHLKIQRVDFSRLVGKALDELAAVPAKVPVMIERDLPEQYVISADPSALKRAVDAVFENSLRYNDKEKIELAVTLRRLEGTCRLDVRDNGVGLDRKEAAQVFNRFYRAGQEISRRRPGSGLGLFLAREIIRAHGGDITAHSDGPGKGATFSITLKSENGDEKNPAG